MPFNDNRDVSEILSTILELHRIGDSDKQTTENSNLPTTALPYIPNSNLSRDYDLFSPSIVPDNELELTGGVAWWVLIFFVPLAIWGIIGNTLVCIAIYTDRRLQNVTNYFLFSLAVADLLVCTIVMPLTIITELSRGGWYLPFWSCLLYVYADVFLCTTSIMHMMVISLDRYLGISQPLKTRNKSTKVVAAKIVIVWLVTILISCPIAIIALHSPENIYQISEPAAACMINNRVYMVCGSVLAFLIPFIIMFLTYVRTTALLKEQAKLVQVCYVNDQPDQSGELANGKTGDKRGLAGQPRNGLRRTVASSKRRTIARSKIVLDVSTAVTFPCHVPDYNQYANAPNRSGVVSFSTPNMTNYLEVPSSGPRAQYKTNRSSVQSQQLGVAVKNEAESMLLEVGPNRPDSMNGSPPNFHKSPSTLTTDSNVTTRIRGILNTLAEKSHINKLTRANTDQELASEEKATRVLGVVFGCFFICWTPFFFCNFLIGFCGELCQPPDTVMTVALWLGYISSTLNPLIYTTFNKRFRQAFRHIMTCQVCMKRRDNAHSGKFTTFNATINNTALERSYAASDYPTPRQTLNGRPAMRQQDSLSSSPTSLMISQRKRTIDFSSMSRARTETQPPVKRPINRISSGTEAHHNKVTPSDTSGSSTSHGQFDSKRPERLRSVSQPNLAHVIANGQVRKTMRPGLETIKQDTIELDDYNPTNSSTSDDKDCLLQMTTGDDKPIMCKSMTSQSLVPDRAGGRGPVVVLLNNNDLTCHQSNV